MLYTAATASPRLLDRATAAGITVFCPGLVSEPDALVEITETRNTSIADTWIRLSYVASGGERNRAPTIVKSRGERSDCPLGANAISRIVKGVHKGRGSRIEMVTRGEKPSLHNGFGQV
ncbi:MAG: hypothetical protein NVSMB53_19890 [Gemmatimonadaceae bacterium]